MDAGSERLLKKLIGLSTVLTLVATSYLLSITVKTQDALNGLPELKEPPYSPNLFGSEKILQINTIVLLVWQFLAVLVAIIVLSINTWAGYASVVIPNFALSIVFVYTLAHQSEYIPIKASGRCKNAKEWPHETKPSMYSVISAHTHSTPEKVCKQFVHETTLEIYLIVSLWLLAMPVIFIALKVIIKMISIILITVFFIITALIIGYTSPPIRFVIGIFRKLRRRNVSSRNQSSDNSDTLELSFVFADHSILNRVLQLKVKNSDEPLLTPYMHYADIVRLTLVSKSIRRTIRADEKYSFPRLRGKTCFRGLKLQCWGCAGQQCRRCCTSKPIKPPKTSVHSDECQTICSRCWFTYHYIPSKRKRFNNKKLCSHRKHLKPGANTAPETSQVVDLCSTCALEPDHIVSAKRERRELAELKHNEDSEVVCLMCRERLHRFSPRWWLCGECGTMCWSRLHSSWVSDSSDFRLLRGVEV